MAKEKKVKNINDVRDRLEVLYLNLESGMVKSCDGKEMANVMGKMINSGKLQLEYNAYMKQRKTIAFLEGK
jgi:hypothetical protein